LIIVNSKVVASTRIAFWYENWFWEAEPNMLKLLVFTFEVTKNVFEGFKSWTKQKLQDSGNLCLFWKQFWKLRVCLDL